MIDYHLDVTSTSISIQLNTMHTTHYITDTTIYRLTNLLVTSLVFSLLDYSNSILNLLL